MATFNFATVQDYPAPARKRCWSRSRPAPLTDIAELLVEYDVVKSSRAFINAAQDTPNSSSIQPGTYRMMTQMRAADAVNTLLNLENLVRDQVTIPEGWRNSEVVQRLAEATGIPVADFEAELADPVNLTLPGWAEGRTEGFLYPETYTFGAEPTAAEILTLMTSQFNTVTEALDFVTRAEELGISPFDAVTIASIIERETRDPAYGPDVAQVIYNRLRADMELQMDSTVHYANDTSGQVTTTDEERGIDSPYNTYRYKGLPPGAISNPGSGHSARRSTRPAVTTCTSSPST